MERALYIGRFQPFHKGHLSTIEAMDQNPKIKEIIIGIGSTQYHYYLSNPFTAFEREKMIKESINTNKPFHIIKIPDFHNNREWVEYIEKLSPQFSSVYTNNSLVKDLFGARGYNIYPSETMDFSATDIRELMIQGRDWQSFVPKGTQKVILEIDGVDRLINLYRKHIHPMVTADVVVDFDGLGVVLIKRGKEPFKNFWALPGGHAEIGHETIEQTATRELFEETTIEVNPKDLKLLGVYSKPQRDPRGPYLTVVYHTKIKETILKALDDASAIGVFPLNSLPLLAFDHAEVIEDYIKLR